MATRKLKQALGRLTSKSLVQPMKPMAYMNPSPKQKSEYDADMKSYEADMAEYRRQKAAMDEEERRRKAASSTFGRTIRASKSGASGGGAW